MRSEITTDIGGMCEQVRKHTSIPCAVGFGISAPEQAKEMTTYADGVIVGCAIMRIVAEYGEQAPGQVYPFLRGFMDNTR